MKEKISSAVFKNLDPSDEQKKRMFDRIINEDAKIESEEISVRYVEENRFSLKNIIYPAAVAVIMICVIASALPALRNMDKQMVAGNESSLTDEAGISAFPIDINKQYRAVCVNNTAHENTVEFYSNYLGTFEGKNCYLAGTGYMYTDLWYTKNGEASSPQRIELYDNAGKPNNGKPLNVTVTSVSAYGDSVLFMGYEAKDEGYSSVFLEYDPSLSILKRRFSVEGVSVYSYTCDDGIIYAVTDHPEGGLQIHVFGKDWPQTVRFGDIGLGSCTYVESMGVSPSGNIIIAAQSGTGKEVVFLDSDLNYIKSEYISDNISDYKLHVTSVVSVNNGHISVLRRNNTDNSVSAECMMLDEYDNITEVKTVPEGISEKLSGYSSCMASESGYDFILKKDDNYYGFNAENAAVNEINCISGDAAEDKGFIQDMKVYDIAGTSEGIYSVIYKYETNLKLTADPYAVSEDELIYEYKYDDYKNYNYSVYLSDEHLYRLVHDSSVVRFTDISSSGITEKTISLSLEKNEYIVSFVVAEEKYVVFSSTTENIIYIYDTETEELRSVSIDKEYDLNDLFINSEGEVIVTLARKYKKYIVNNENWGAWKIDLKEGKLTESGITDTVFLSADYHQKGTDGYSAFCFSPNGVYGLRKADTGMVCEKILNPDNIDFENYQYRVNGIDGIYCDANGDVYLSSGGYAFKLTEKY